MHFPSQLFNTKCTIELDMKLTQNNIELEGRKRNPIRKEIVRQERRKKASYFMHINHIRLTAGTHTFIKPVYVPRKAMQPLHRSTASLPHAIKHAYIAFSPLAQKQQQIKSIPISLQNESHLSTKPHAAQVTHLIHRYCLGSHSQNPNKQNSSQTQFPNV